MPLILTKVMVAEYNINYSGSQQTLPLLGSYRYPMSSQEKNDFFHIYFRSLSSESIYRYMYIQIEFVLLICGYFL